MTMSKRLDRGSVYWIRIQMQPTPAEQQDMNAKSALFNAYRTHGVASANLISDTDLMNLIRNGIAAAVMAEVQKYVAVEPTLTLEEAAKELKISVTVMRQLCRERRIRAVRLDKSYRIRVRDLNAYLDERTIEADGGAA